MTNEEAVKKVLVIGCGRIGKGLNETLELIEENDKLKAEIERLELYAGEIINARNLSEETATSIRAKMQRELMLAREIEQLRGSRRYILEINGSLVRINDKQDREITKLKDEIEQLKSELEQSVKLPCKIGDIIYTTNWLRNQVFKNITTGFQVYDGEIFILTYEGLRISNKNMGSHLFITEEEAEQSLKGQV